MDLIEIPRLSLWRRQLLELAPEEEILPGLGEQVAQEWQALALSPPRSQLTEAQSLVTRWRKVAAEARIRQALVLAQQVSGYRRMITPSLKATTVAFQNTNQADVAACLEAARAVVTECFSIMEKVERVLSS